MLIVLHTLHRLVGTIVFSVVTGCFAMAISAISWIGSSKCTTSWAEDCWIGTSYCGTRPVQLALAFVNAVGFVMNVAATSLVTAGYRSGVRSAIEPGCRECRPAVAVSLSIF